MDQPRYFPFLHGVYDVKAGIQPLGRDHGNGDRDGQVFQLDESFGHYRAAKCTAARTAGRHVLRDALPIETERHIARWIADRLLVEHPQHFTTATHDASGGAVACALTGETVHPEADAAPLDALAMQVQDDLAVLTLDDAGHNRIGYLHVSMPSGWPPEKKIGRPFDAVHRPVPHIEPISAKQDAIAKLMVNATRGAVRFAWTVTTDAALNHHPRRDPAVAGPSPLPDHPAGEPLLRVERQVIWGFPALSCSLFTIRTYLYPFAGLDAAARRALGSAVAGMSEVSLRYKNMDRAAILARLDG